MKPLLLLALAILLSACSTTQEVLLAKANPTRQIVSVAVSPDDGNSPEMNANLTGALTANGLGVRAPVPRATRKSTEVDAIVTYVDVWRWDLAMYMQNLTISIYDAASGDLLVMGRWADSAFHGFRDARLVMEGLVTEMVTKLRAATSSPP